MFIGEILPFVRAYVNELDMGLRQIDPQARLTRIQQGWLGFCLVAILVTNSICWKRFERASLGRFSSARVSWMFRQHQRWWESVLRASAWVILHRYGISKGVLVLDDSEKKRARQTTRIYKAHTVKDKKSGGYLHGQSFIVLLLVTGTVTLPVGAEFYMPDPALTVWHAAEKRLRKQGVPKQHRPVKPKLTSAYPSKLDIALGLLKAFQRAFPAFVVQCVLADALYGSKGFVNQASSLFGGIQVITQLRQNQTVQFRGKRLGLLAFFTRYPGISQRIRIRGGREVTVWVSSARLLVCAHGTKRFVIALKYEGEEEYRYLVASDLSWRTLDIIQAHTLRWLVEVFIQDWKAYEGWGQLTKQPDEEGSRRSLTLSLLCDHCLLLHPDQLARVKDNLPAFTVGSLRDRVKVDSLIQFLKDLLASEHPLAGLEEVAQRAKEVFTLNESSKHMVGRDVGRLEPTPSLEYRAHVAMKTA
jgi:hypothetical protein